MIFKVAEVHDCFTIAEIFARRISDFLPPVRVGKQLKKD